MSQPTASRDNFIAAMRCVASSVCVVTTAGQGVRHGATVSAFCSVSADPPTILVCLNLSSTIARLVQENKVFNISVLPEGFDEIANRFAGAHDTVVGDRFDGIEITGDAVDEVPGIVGATLLRCTLAQAVKEGTHLICIGRVSEITLGAQMPLTYLAGRYHPLSPLTDPQEEL